jgi:ribosome recycling factor
VTVESYGTKVPLNQVASVTVSDAKTLTISPWDKSLMQAIEKGIQAANLGLNPGNDGNVIRLTLPPMTEDRRKELVKVVSQLGEQCRISIRKVREDVMKALKKAKEDGQIGEDDVAIGQKKVQDMIDSYNSKIKDIISDKEKEIMTV